MRRRGRTRYVRAGGGLKAAPPSGGNAWLVVAVVALVVFTGAFYGLVCGGVIPR